MNKKLDIKLKEIYKKNGKSSIHYDIKNSVWSKQQYDLKLKKYSIEKKMVSKALEKDIRFYIDILSTGEKKDRSNLFEEIAYWAEKSNTNEVAYVWDKIYERSENISFQDLKNIFKINDLFLIECFKLISSLERSYLYGILAILKTSGINLWDVSTYKLSGGNKGDLEYYLEKIKEQGIMDNGRIVKSMTLNTKRDLYKFLNVDIKLKMDLFFFNINKRIKEKFIIDESISKEYQRMFKMGKDVLDKLITLRNKVFHADFIILKDDIKTIEAISRWQKSPKSYFIFTFDERAFIEKNLIKNIHKEIISKFGESKGKELIEKINSL